MSATNTTTRERRMAFSTAASRIDEIDFQEIEGLLEKAGVNANADEEDEPEQKTWRTYLKLVIPHVGLVLVTIVYGIIGSFIFYSVEHPHEQEIKTNSIRELQQLRQQLIQGMWREAREGLSKEAWKQNAEARLVELFSAYYKASEKSFVTYRDIQNAQKPDTEKEDTSIWTPSSALFFAITTMATIGYGHVVPASRKGRVICTFFALVGTPIAIITIGDLGKFFSEYTVWAYRKYKQLKDKFRRKLHARFRRCSVPAVLHASTIDAADDEFSSQFEFDDFVLDKKAVPVVMVFGILLCYIAIGALMFSWIEDWPYVKSFYFCFISLTTIGFGDIVPKRHEYLGAMLLYICVGLAITTMCIDLVGYHYINKIHHFGRKFKGSDLLQLLRRKRQLERQIALAQQSQMLDWWFEQQQQQHQEDKDQKNSNNSRSDVPPLVLRPWLKSDNERTEVCFDPMPEQCDNVSLTLGTIFPQTNSQLEPLSESHTLSSVSSISDVVSSETTPQMPCSLSTSPSVYERVRNYDQQRRQSVSSWAPSGPDIVTTISLESSPSIQERQLLYQEHRLSRSSWTESGPDISAHCSLSTEASVSERERLYQLRDMSSPLSGSDNESEWHLYAQAPHEPSHAIEQLLVDSAQKFSVKQSQTLQQIQPETVTFLPEESKATMCIESLETLKTKIEATVSSEALPEHSEQLQNSEVLLNLEMDEWNDEEEELNPPSLLSPLDLDLELPSSVFSSPLSSPTESVLDFGDAETLEFPCDSGMSTETESEQQLERNARDDSVISYHQNIPIYCVESRPIDSEQAISKALHCPDKCVSAETPQLVTENYCFVLDGDKVKLADITSGDHWWKPTGHPTKYYYSEDMKTFQKVQILLIRGRVISARLTRQPQRASSRPQLHSSHSSLDSTRTSASTSHLAEIQQRLETRDKHREKQPTTTDREKLDKWKHERGSSSGSEKHSQKSPPELHHQTPPSTSSASVSIGHTSREARIENSLRRGTAEEVPLSKVYKVTRFYSFWKTCTGFHRIVTVISPVAPVSKAEYRRRIFVQYLWRDASMADKKRVAVEFNPKTQKLMQYSSAVDPSKRRSSEDECYKLHENGSPFYGSPPTSPKCLRFSVNLCTVLEDRTSIAPLKPEQQQFLGINSQCSPTYHQDVPIFSVQNHAVDAESALQSTLVCPTEFLSKAPPSSVFENYCFVVDGNEIKTSELTKTDNWWKPTGRSRRYFFSEDLKTFHKVEVVEQKRKIISARLRRRSSLSPTSPDSRRNSVSPSPERRLSTTAITGEKASQMPLSFLEDGGFLSIALSPQYQAVPLEKVFQVSRFYSYWKSCTAFHRIITLVRPIADHTTADGTRAAALQQSDFYKRYFMQYLWRNPKQTDKLRVCLDYGFKLMIDEKQKQQNKTTKENEKCVATAHCDEPTKTETELKLKL